ncbi:TetR/AcrR family transcriptional regulator [Saccharopolyspora sp. NFXS83]|uniref:TetR/AcrR family transcriptional regulator n=1 Tax=Saccharopolyspora sp. NFXS83 TaxID=2993560 RepID=UPI00224B724A|nr:TetR/AcrR family transcriptional regulator [Saccharopolyspora sp. NFXS83]MCX2733783.1 TetR/AcrR family transcriptional regulator [Saccharopolyspora sp. NFXS83]
MSPRRSAAEARATRARIIHRATEIASAEGLEGVTIGRLAGELEMSKSGVLGHFGTKEALQASTLDDAFADFWRRVVEAAEQHRQGMPRLRALCENSVSFLATLELPGGCLLTAASSEFDGRPGLVRDAVAERWSWWRGRLRDELSAAATNGELPAHVDVDQAVFEIIAVGLALNQALQLDHDPQAVDRAHRAIHRILETAPQQP